MHNIVLSLFIVVNSIVSTNGAKGVYTLLLETIFQDYNTDARPVYDGTTSTEVYFEPEIFRIINIDAKNQMMISEGSLHLEWQDEFLVWDPANYDGIEEIKVDASKVWKPAFYIANSVSEEHAPHGYSTTGVVHIAATGHVTWYIYVTFMTTCDIYIKYFPFDEQNCGLEIDLLFTQEKHVNFTHPDESELAEDAFAASQRRLPRDQEWIQITTLTCEKNYDDETYYLWCGLTAERVDTFYVYNFLVPCVLFIFLGFMTFFLPAESGERVNLAVTAFLAMTVFLIFFMDRMPPSSKYIPIMQCLEYFVSVVLSK